MKLEDVKRIVLEAGQRLTGKAPPADVTPDSFWSTLTPTEQDVVRAIAELCEQHGVERTKAGIRDCMGILGMRQPLDWSEFDKEIQQENAHGKTKTD